MLIVDLADPSGIRALAEPFFLRFNADCVFRVVMKREDIKKARLDELGRKCKEVASAARRSRRAPVIQVLRMIRVGEEIPALRDEAGELHDQRGNQQR